MFFVLTLNSVLVPTHLTLRHRTKKLQCMLSITCISNQCASQGPTDNLVWNNMKMEVVTSVPVVIINVKVYHYSFCVAFPCLLMASLLALYQLRAVKTHASHFYTDGRSSLPTANHQWKWLQLVEKRESDGITKAASIRYTHSPMEVILEYSSSFIQKL